MALAKDRETLDFDVPGELRFTPKVHRRVRKSWIRAVCATGSANQPNRRTLVQASRARCGS